VKPTQADILYGASKDALEMALRHDVHAVIVVSAMFLHPDVLILMKRAGLKTFVLFTESPYDLASGTQSGGDGRWLLDERAVSGARVSAGQSAERVSAARMASGEARPLDAPMLDVPAHDVVFVGSGFPERIEWFNAIDWTGIDLGLYGTWKGLGLNKHVAKAIRGEQVSNLAASALYRKAKIGLNLYRTRNQQRMRVTGESLSAARLRARGVWRVPYLRYRPEVAEVFGEKVPTFRTPAEASALIQTWLSNDSARLEHCGSITGLCG
jgi:hypothetical protein